MVMTVCAYGQQTVITGKVTDGGTGEVLPFVNVFFKGTSIGAQTDFDGMYEIRTDKAKDTLVCMAMGYQRREKIVKKGQSQRIDFQLAGDEGHKLDEVVIKAGENPAYAIIRKAVANKSKNDKRNLTAYEYESYNKIELDIDQISNKLKKRKLFRQIGQLMDSLQKIAGEDGRPILPLFISESYSKIYKTNNPDRTREEVQATHITGVGMDDASVLSQIVGGTFQEYNFYKNYLSILNKDVVSPISDNWKVYYEFFLIDSSFVDNYWCYRIDMQPKNPLDLAFTGSIWITDSSWAIKRIDAAIDKRANVNFIDKIRIQQELEPTAAGPWLPVKNRVLVDVAELADSTAGMLAKFYSANKKFYINRPRSADFYEEQISVAEDSKIQDKSFWAAHRPDTLTDAEKSVFMMIDTLRKLPVVNAYVEIVETSISGYYKVGKLDIGHYLALFAYNTREGLRLRIGGKTNSDFSKKVTLAGYLAYGFRDETAKYGFQAKYLFSRRHWTEAAVYHLYDIGQLAYSFDDLRSNALLEAFSRWSRYRRAYYATYSGGYIGREFTNGLTGRIRMNSMYFEPLFNFGYYNDPERGVAGGTSTNFRNTEITFEGRFAFKELLLQSGNERISLGTKKFPIITAGVTVASKGMLEGDFTYQRLNLDLKQTLRLGVFGKGTYHFSTGAYLEGAPYPLLKLHQGNQSFFYNSAAYNTMNYFEFVSDRWASVNYMHQFEGFFFNRVPLLKRLKIRELAGFNVLEGAVSSRNLDYIPVQYRTVDGRPAYQGLGADPYVEVFYGVENILKFIRVAFVHRMTYLDQPYGFDRFGIKLSAYFTL